jgi:hypothetical protein
MPPADRPLVQYDTKGVEPTVLNHLHTKQKKYYFIYKPLGMNDA